MNLIFPFTAIIGIQKAKTALICHAIDPKLGGVLLMGHRGCAKSTLARSFSTLLLTEHNLEAPFVEVPLGTTEDHLVGSVDTHQILEKGKWGAKRGLIEQANQGVLYIDEVNLLADHLTDYILDSAASGIHRIERDNISKLVEAKYVLIGTMNPEEGDLRPQLSDRFAQGVRISDEYTTEERKNIVKTRMEFEDNPESFILENREKIDGLRNQIVEAKKKVKSMAIPEHLRIQVAEKANQLQLEGVRAELAVLRTSRCLAAWNLRDKVTSTDIEEAWELCLEHRDKENLPRTPQPPSSPVNSGEPQENQLAEISTSPTEAHVQGIKLNLPRKTPNQKLMSWWKLSQAETNVVQKLQFNFNRQIRKSHPENKIDWSLSLVHSLTKNWRPGGSNFSFHYKKSERKSNVWIFLDASRSTGASNFLSDLCNLLLSIRDMSSASRYYVLLLKDSKTYWWIKRGSGTYINLLLRSLDEARGKSYLAKSIQILNRAILKQGTATKDRIILCSDGLPSPEPGLSSKATVQKFRRNLQNIERTQIPICWIQPKVKKSLKRFVESIHKGLNIHLIQLDKY